MIPAQDFLAFIVSGQVVAEEEGGVVGTEGEC